MPGYRHKSMDCNCGGADLLSVLYEGVLTPNELITEQLTQSRLICQELTGEELTFKSLEEGKNVLLKRDGDATTAESSAEKPAAPHTFE